MNIVILIWITVVIILSLVIWLLDVSTRGFISTFILCRVSRGKKVFLTIKSINDRYFRPGKVNEKNYVNFKDQNNVPQKITVPDNYEFDIMFGFRSMVYLEHESCIEKHTTKIETKDKEGHKTITVFTEKFYTYDTKKNQDLYDRSLKSMDIKNTRELFKKNLIPLIILIGVIVTAFLVFNVYQRQEIIGEMLMSIQESIKSIQTKGVIP